jgi:hypothetical protein
MEVYPESGGFVGFHPTEQLSEETIEKLALCVQRAGLWDIEDVYLNIIAPLTQKIKLPSPQEVLELALENAIKKQS